MRAVIKCGFPFIAVDRLNTDRVIHFDFDGLAHPQSFHACLFSFFSSSFTSMFFFPAFHELNVNSRLRVVAIVYDCVNSLN